MKLSYGVVWSENGDEQPGCLTLGPHALELEADRARTIPYSEVEWVETQPEGSIVMKLRHDGEVRVNGSAQRWILHDLTERLLADAREPHVIHPGLGL
jgi:hypothetical protein